MFRRIQRPCIWLALVAMLALAMLPSVSHALSFARGGGGSWAEVCTPQGMRLVAVEQAVDGSTPATDSAPLQAAGFMEHCALCALAADQPALPTPAAAAAVPLNPGSHALPPAFLHGPRTLHVWRSAQPRGPPSIS